MYWSKYNILSKSEKYGYLLFNTMSLAFIRINEQDIDMWKKLRETPDSYTNFQNYDFLINNGSLKFEITAKRLYAASQRVL